MSQYRLSDVEVGQNYKAKELDSFVSTTDVVVLSNNESQLFTDPEREYKVVNAFEGFFEHSSEDGEKYYREKTAFVVEKV
ncbi:hypothetical protein LCL89_10985 [Halobacillus yeomjeoni]|uniref:Uncharacterized protein n=1 Tax=Halobacillus yeomjeoni TaxID=311194 RepID=A0A931HWH8_9BACI|nr:hypothetical protein [Halobacillus yeomjeoni]MBH0230990.1 hypothetical protein [Halobacillus yeomjeoni]MCA0984569.1 hypothetical protein [Halobacillus yeomjeoni]